MSKTLNIIVNGADVNIPFRGKGSPISTAKLVFAGEYTNRNGGWMYISVVSGSTYLVPHAVTVHTLNKTQAKSLKVPEGTQLVETIRASKLELGKTFGLHSGNWGYEPAKSEPAVNATETAESF